MGSKNTRNLKVHATLVEGERTRREGKIHIEK
jgi:hypothetical protein